MWVSSEWKSTSEPLNRARQLIEDADTVCFLGFGYDELNVTKLNLDAKPQSGKYLGTAYHLENAEGGLVQQLFQRAGGISLAGPHVDATMFLRHHAGFLK